MSTFYEKDEFDEDMMMAILDDMKRLENWIRLVGQGVTMEVSLSYEDFW